MSIITSKVRAAAAAGVLGLAAAAGPALADAVVTATNAANFTFNAGTPTLLATGAFFNNANQRFLVTFSAECAVNAPAGNNSAWTDIDIQVLNAGGAVVATLAPTIGAADAFCTANGTAGFDGWHTNAMTAIGGSGLAAGNYSVRVIGRLNAGATGGWYGERSLVVWR